ncbi:MAG: molecular chaperone HtpG [Kiritimatiellia bacterium]
MSKTTKAFQTEVQQLLHLVIHSLYSNKEIFLRELVSNASDAIDRARFEGLSDKEITEPAGGWRITLTPDADAGTLTISDNGVGMTAEEAEKNIGTIASSGTRRFLDELKKTDAAHRPELIGQFGVGFYASFMVADKVTVVSRRAGAGTSAIRWESAGDGSYTLEDAERAAAGTDIVLHLKDDAKEYLDAWKLRQIVKRYSDYVAFPVVLVNPKAEKDEEKESTLNSMKAIWTRPKSEVKPEEYNEFYKATLHDFSDPHRVIHYSAEGALEFKALLFLPARPSTDLFTDVENRGMHLYVKRVFIMNNCKELLPTYLRFMKGVVDSSDLPLNVSREILQEDALIRKIRKNLVKKVLDTLQEMKDSEPKEYRAFWSRFGRCSRKACMWIMRTATARQALVLVETAVAGRAGRMVLAQGLRRPHAARPEGPLLHTGQESRRAVENSPVLERFKVRGIEVIFLIGPIDEWILGDLEEFDGRKMVAVHRGQVDLGDKDREEGARGEAQGGRRVLRRPAQEDPGAAGRRRRRVRLSDRLTESASCLVSAEGQPDPHMLRIMRSMGNEFPEAPRILEVNPSLQPSSA